MGPELKDADVWESIIIKPIPKYLFSFNQVFQEILALFSGFELDTPKII